MSSRRFFAATRRTISSTWSSAAACTSARCARPAIVFHMLSALGSAGRLGLTAVGDSPEEARAIFEKAEAVLKEEAQFDQL